MSPPHMFHQPRHAVRTSRNEQACREMCSGLGCICPALDTGDRPLTSPKRLKVKMSLVSQNQKHCPIMYLQSKGQTISQAIVNLAMFAIQLVCHDVTAETTV